jgi:ParB family chromosome partitioning protein
MVQKKWADPLEKLLDADSKVSKTNAYLANKKSHATGQTTALAKNLSENSGSSKDDNKVHTINPNLIRRWERKDRPSNELGDIQALANDFINVGQQQPCIVRSILDSEYKYELIIGERRWRAAMLAKINLDVIVKNNFSDFDAALSQAAENDNRLDLSDYAKGMSFAKLIDDKIMRQKDLTERLGKSKQYISSLLSFSKIPKEIIDSVDDWSKVSSRTSKEIVSLSKKGDVYIKQICALSERIKSGKMGWNSLNKVVIANTLKKGSLVTENQKILSKDGRHIFTWRADNNSLPSIHFPKQINDLFSSNKINLEAFTNDIIMSLEQKLKDLQ